MMRGLLGLVAAAWLVAMPARAATLFTEVFDSSLSQWTNPIRAGKIVAAPDGANALTFGVLQGGSQLLTTLSSSTSATGSFTIAFDIYTNCGFTSGCGAFLLAVGNWTLSDTPFGSAVQFADALGAWERVTYTFAGSSTTLAFEDWNGSPHAAAYPGAHAFYMRNLVLTDNPGHVTTDTVVVSAAQGATAAPGSLVLLAGALGGLVAARRRATAGR